MPRDQATSGVGLLSELEADAGKAVHAKQSGNLRAELCFRGGIFTTPLI
jgi:hypothetical protein